MKNWVKLHTLIAAKNIQKFANFYQKFETFTENVSSEIIQNH